MQEPLQISFHGMEPSPAIEALVRAKAAELDKFYDRITSCNVTLEAAHHRHHKGNLYSVHVDVRLPGKEIVAGRKRAQHHSHEDAYVAIRDAFDAAERQLEDYARKRRGDVKRHAAER
jgi:ribosomal subunit interface protein